MVFAGGICFVSRAVLGDRRGGNCGADYGLGEQKEEEEAPKDSVVIDSTISEGLKQRLLFMPFRDKSKYKGEWDIYSAMPRGLADSLRGSAFFTAPCPLIRRWCD